MPRFRSDRTQALHAQLARAAHGAPALLGSPRSYLLIHGTAHSLVVNESIRATSWLTDFSWLQLRTGSLPTGTIPSLTHDFTAVARTIPVAERRAFGLWEAFIREREHMLRRGDAEWPANRILLQLAVEHADDSPVTKAAEAWLETGACDWVWLKRAQRVAHAAASPCLRVLEGHTWQVDGALALPDGRLLSWSQDNTLRLWDGATAAALGTLVGHTRSVRGALALPDGRLLSWSWDHTLRLWDGATGVVLGTLVGHTKGVTGARALPDGRLLSWSGDKTLRLWDGATGAAIATLEGHTHWVNGALALPDGRLLSWSHDKTLRLWDGATGAALAKLEGHTGGVEGAIALPDGRLLSWSQTLRLWDGATGAALVTLEGHTGRVRDALALPDGRLLSWSSDGTLRLWDGATGAALATLEGHTNWVKGALALPDGRLLSWSWGGTLRLWDGATGAHLDCVDQTEVQHTHPDLYLAWSRAESPNIVQQHTVAQGNARGLTLYHAGHPIHWHADGYWTAYHLLPDGTVVARCDKHLAILHLHHGNRRVSVDEAESLTVAAQSALVFPPNHKGSLTHEHRNTARSPPRRPTPPAHRRSHWRAARRCGQSGRPRERQYRRRQAHPLLRLHRPGYRVGARVAPAVRNAGPRGSRVHQLRR